MLFRCKSTPPPPNIKPHIGPAAQLYKAAMALPSQQLCNAIYSVLGDKPDILPEHIEELANRLGRIAHERNR